ncbi:MAG: TonB-dependent receptor [Acidobacteriota bacterium]
MPWRITGAFIGALLLTPAGPAAAQSATAAAELRGVVLDQTAGALPGAAVTLSNAVGRVVRSTETDGIGGFHFDAVPPGTYNLRVVFTGFKPGVRRVRVGARQPPTETFVLALEDVTQDVTVGSGGADVGATSASNLDAIAIDRDALESVPIFDQDYVSALSRFLDAGALGSGGPTIVVNGMEVSALRVSASAVQQIKINQDPYSAEYARPGRGRIEILTKPGGQTFEGEGNVSFRDAHLDARNAFATTRPPERKRILEGSLGGPVGHGGTTSFVLSADDQSDDQQAEVFALGVSGAIHEVAPQQNREALVAMSLIHQWSDRTTISIRPSYEYEQRQNRGVGGLTLASAGTTFTHHEQQLTYTQQTALRPTLLNQFQMLVGHEREPTVSASAERGVVVAGAFTSGGQGDLVQTEVHTQLTESLVWIRGHHQVQGGFQLPDWSRRGFFDRTNVAGTYYFGGLEAYAAGRPYAFIQQQGNGDLAFLEKQVGTYLKDDWQVRPGLSLSLGVRYDWQNYFHDVNNVAPRLSLAYAPGDSRANVIRAGIGIFNDRSGAGAIADLLHSGPGGLVRTVVSNPSYPDPFPAGATVLAQPASIVRLATNVQIPQTVQYSLGLDHQLRKGLTLSTTITGARGYHLFRSRDVNAPLPPLFASRPNAAYGAVREIQSDGRQDTESLQVTLRGKLGRWYSGQSQYTWSQAHNDTSGITSYPANDYDTAGEWGRADFDRRHRFLLLGSVNPGRVVDLGVGVTLTSGAPYTETLGADVFNNGRGRARPVGVPRNSRNGAGTAQFDFRLSRSAKFGSGKDRHAITYALDVFNLLNRVNYSAYVGTVGSPLFGQPVSARAPRQLQLSGRIRF